MFWDIVVEMFQIIAGHPREGMLMFFYWFNFCLLYSKRYEKQQETFQYLPPSPVLSHPYMTRPESDTSSTLTGEEDEE